MGRGPAHARWRAKMNTQMERPSAQTAPRIMSSGPILVGTDGTAQSEGAMAAAVGLAAPLGTQVQVAAVLPPLAVVVADGGMMLGAEEEGARRDALLSGAEAHVARWRGRGPIGLAELHDGEPARVI